MNDKKKVIIIGAGFGGLNAAKALKNKNVEITLIDKTNHHLFQPLLYQVATAALSPGDIAIPIREVFANQQNVTVLMANVQSINVEEKTIQLFDDQINYDYLIIATGSRHSYFGKDEWEKHAPGLKTFTNALTIRERILLSFEIAERYYDKEDITPYLTFSVVGGGPTGVELAGSIAEVAKKSLFNNFRKINPEKTKIYLIEGSDRILEGYDEALSKKAKSALEKMGVTVLTGHHVTEVDENGVWIGERRIDCKQIIWAAGNEASPLVKSTGVETDRAGRAIVENDCSIKDHPEVFIIGDAGLHKDKNGKTLPGIAPVAIQQGRYAAKIIGNFVEKEKRLPFKYFDKGSMATIGRAHAVTQIKNIKVSGFIAWLIWSFVHIAYLINFRNKFMVMAEWVWNYITFNRGIRLITGKVDRLK